MSKEADESLAIDKPEKSTEVISLAVTSQELADLKDFVSRLLVKDHDYGTLPRIPKPFLMKPGAEKLCKFFGFGIEIDCIEQIQDFDKNLFCYKYKATVRNKKTGVIEAQCEGSANNKEKKYFAQDGPSIANTLQKMAQKRAFVGATIIATMTSEYFTQDVEDMAPEVLSAAARAPQSPRQSPARGSGSYSPTPTAPIPCPICGNQMYDNRENKRNPRAPDMKCKNYKACDGVIWSYSEADGGETQKPGIPTDDDLTKLFS